MKIEVEERVAELLTSLRAQAAARKVSLESYLEQFVENPPEADNRDPIAIADFDRVLDELSAASLIVSSLPVDFSRADIYADHD